jgi:hypothetical protein
MREEMRSRLALAELARAQHGVVGTDQLTGLGHSRTTISREVKAGRLHRVHHGAYSVGHSAISRHGRCLAAVIACGDGALLSHQSAAWLWGLSPVWSNLLCVTANSPRRRRPAITIHSSARLSGSDRERCELIPVTAVPRTLLDFAAANQRSLPRAVQRAERLDLLDLGLLDGLLSRNPGARGAERLRDAISAYREPAFTRSGLERRFLQLVTKAGLPRPSMNFFVAGYELDAYWPRQRFAVELDTFEYHGGRGAFEEDRIRQENLKLAGIEMTRITGSRIGREPAAVMQRLRKLLSMRR